MDNSVVREILEQQVLSVAKAVEDKIDDQISALDRMDPDDMEALRERRLQQMKKMAEKRSRWISLGHGEYSEIYNEKEFFSVVKASERVVCHFYRENWPCKKFRVINPSRSFESVSSNVPSPAKKKVRGKAMASTASEAAPESTERTKAVPYSPEESEHLVKVWSSISKDPSVGDRQKEVILWGKVVARYNATIGIIGYKPRNKKMLKGHWQRMMPKCNLFHGYYVQAHRDWKSGKDARDVFSNACHLYYAATKQHFQYGKAYKQLQLLPKYDVFLAQNKKQKGTDGSSNSNNLDAEKAEDDRYFLERSRPIGTKQAMAQARNNGKGKEAEETIDLEAVPDEDETQFLQSNTKVNQTYLSLAQKKMHVLEKKTQVYKSKIMTLYSKLLAIDTSNMSEEQLEQHQILLAKMWNMIEQ